MYSTVAREDKFHKYIVHRQTVVRAQRRRRRVLLSSGCMVVRAQAQATEGGAEEVIGDKRRAGGGWGVGVERNGGWGDDWGCDGADWGRGVAGPWR